MIPYDRMQELFFNLWEAVSEEEFDGSEDNVTIAQAIGMKRSEYIDFINTTTFFVPSKGWAPETSPAYAPVKPKVDTKLLETAVSKLLDWYFDYLTEKRQTMSISEFVSP